MKKIPFVDLLAQYLSIKTDIDQAIFDTIENSLFIGGESVARFEKSFGELIGCDHVVSCANGTDSLEILLKSFGIGKGDEVIVPAISWISTSEAVSNCGAKPVFVDIEEEYFCIDPFLIEKAITPKTKAIIPVHLYGQPANMKLITDIAMNHKLIIIEDCAQAHLAAIEGKLVGTWGHAASFSFYPGKNLGAYGDAGAITTNDQTIAKRARMIANHGQEGKHNHIMEGRNSRMDSIQAAILNAKLPYLKSWTKLRQEKAIVLHDLIFKEGLAKVPKIRSDANHVFHLFVIRTENRYQLQEWLKQNNIETAIHYPTALPFLSPYQSQQLLSSDYPVSAIVQNEILSLPLYPELQITQIARIVDTIRSFKQSGILTA
jgi:dTDP-4-amino-4,6-dideoxygalactose transaminase